MHMYYLSSALGILAIAASFLMLYLTDGKRETLVDKETNE